MLQWLFCTFDPFKKGRAQYTFGYLCEEDTRIWLNDGTKKIFFNSTDYDKAEDEDVREFLRYVNGEKSNNSFVQALNDKVEKVKLSKEWRREYMTLLMREEAIRDETREEGIRKLVSSLKFYSIPDEGILQQLMKQYQLTMEEASAFLNQE